MSRDRRLTFTPRPERQPDAETLAWIATIEAIRQEEAGSCPSCGCADRHAMQRKRCTICKAVKLLIEFHRDAYRSDGRRSECGPCSDAIKKRRRIGRHVVDLIHAIRERAS